MFDLDVSRTPEVVPDLSTYDRFVIAFSGGKDSIACFLHLLESGVQREKIELWHHDVDGREGNHFMDWPCTPAGPLRRLFRSGCISRGAKAVFGAKC
jgi:hypothetical protein